MTTSNTNIDNTVDPLAMAAGSVAEPTFPVVAEGKKRLLIRELTHIVADGKERANLRLELTEPDRSTEGDDLYPGFGIFTTMFLTPNEYNTIQDIAKECAMFVKAALGKDTTTSFRDCLKNPDLIVGKLVDVQIANKTKEGKTRSNVKRWFLPA